MLKAASSALGQRVAANLERRYVERAKRHEVGGTRELREGWRRGEIREGDRVSGTGYFSLYTQSGVPAPTQSSRFTEQVLKIPTAENGPRLLYPTTAYPLSQGGVRIAFVYPHDLWGFGELMWRRGRSEPCHEGIPLMVRSSDWVGMEDRIIRFHARVETIRPEDLEDAFGQLDQDLFDNLARSGALHFLNAVPDDFSVSDFETPPQHGSSLLGLHYLIAHWDPTKATRPSLFQNQVKVGLEAALDELGYRNMRKTTDHLLADPISIRWGCNGIEVYQPSTGPVVHLQTETDLRASSASRDGSLRTLQKHVFESLREFQHDAPNDADSTDLSMPNLTVLESPEARAIQHPSLRALRSWIQRNYAEIR